MMSVKEGLSSWFGNGYSRALPTNHLKVFNILAIGLSIYQVWSVIFGKLDPMNQMAIHLSAILTLTFLFYGYSSMTTTEKKKNIPTIFDYIFSSLAFLAGIYFTYHAGRFAVRIPFLEPLTGMDIFFGLIIILLTIEATRRTIGSPIIILIFIGFIYTLFGHHLTGVWYHRELGVVEFIDELAFSFNGLWGSPISVAATFVFIFLLFGAFLKQAGAGEFFFRLSTAIAGRTRGGPAKVAVLASAFFGSISGSPTANVVTTGTFTIPVSKKTGYSGRFAAAMEAAASTGGSILPPIMGSSAFLMAAVTQIPYGQIAIAATVPALLYYGSLLIMVHLEAIKKDLPRPKEADIPRAKDVLKEGWYYFIPLIILVYFLVQGYSTSRTGFYGILAVIVVSWFRKETRMGLRKIGKALIDGAKTAIPVTAACAAAGLIIAGIMTTGLGGKLTSIVLSLTNGMLIPTLILVMLICIVLGMGMPVAAAYILTAMLAAPALIELGISPLAAHLFIVYFSIFSAITPPVAVAAYAAAGIANENPNRVGFEAVRLGIVGFVIPFIFVLNPALLLNSPLGEIMIAIFFAIISIISLSASMIGLLKERIGSLGRIILCISGVMCIAPNLIINVAGLGLLLFVFWVSHHRTVLVKNQKVELEK